VADDRTTRGLLNALKADRARAEAIATQRNVWRKVDALVATLSQLMDRDPEQEVQGIAVPVLAEVIKAAPAAPLARRQRQALPCEARPPHAGPQP
jgi:hypothetical protein